VSINLSSMQFRQPNLVEMVLQALTLFAVDPAHLELELTESVVMSDVEASIATLGGLKALGLNISIDDFGTGYSSLSYLMHYPFDYIKIDRSFIRDMMHNRDHAVLTNAIVTMARSLKLGVVAEGVETPEQLARVREMGCDEIQGFYFSQAVSATLFSAVVADINAAATAATRH
jgi:EAL domain-containing protein (putative c-di-GMP-specific phosphodiesterase class I)